MRALSKIIFINSAHIRYEEIRLDGNVHFTGTQGVGKSTLLRAILFFYNAEKLHLGIPREMKSFDDFYLPHANSYIVYEVEHEHGPFSILVNRSSYGRASFRFIDSPFKKEWLIDEFGDVTAEQTVINSRLGKIDWRRVEDYTQYRDVIYGNIKNNDKRFSRYRLMETQSYRNIYRSIQNVFLNSRLDADFIKDIIIRSMNEEEAHINLGYYRNQVADFEQEYLDISRWYNVNQKGESPVRLQADRAIGIYHDLLYLKSEITRLCGELNYSVRVSAEKLPLITKQLEKLEEEASRQQRLLSEVQNKFESEKSGLDQALGEVNANIRKCKEKKEFYARLDIDDVMRRCEQEDGLRLQLDALRQRLTLLTSQYEDITLKYKRLAEDETTQCNLYCQTQKQHEMNLREQAFGDKEIIRSKRDKKKEELDAFFEDKKTTADEMVESIKKELDDVDKSIFELKHFNPYEELMEGHQHELSDLRTRQQTLKPEILALEESLSRMQAEFEKRETDILAAHAEKLREKKQEVADTESEIAETESLLAKTKGSLYEWLEENVTGWEQNIGKVIDEKNVLYRTGLAPTALPGTESSFYGVQLNLSDLPMSVRRPDELKALKKDLEFRLTSLKKECLELENTKNAEISALEKHFSPRMKEIRDKRGALLVEQSTIPNRIKAVEVRISDLQKKTEEEREAKRNQLETRRREIAHRHNEAREKNLKIRQEHDKQAKAIDKEFRTALANLEAGLKIETERILESIRKRTKEREAALLRLGRQELEELKGKGADTSAVEKCKNEIAHVNDQLRYIEENRQLVYSYRKDKEELFDREEEFKSNKKTLVEKLKQLQEKFDIRRKDHETRIANFLKEISERQEEEKKINEGLKAAQLFMDDSKLCPPTLPDAKEQKTLLTPTEAVSELTGTIVNRQNRQTEFRQSINLFKANFSAKNTFNFKTELNTEEDYLDYASNLDDFIRNNKIEDYRSRVNARYIEILRRVSKEMGDLTRYESEVNKVIGDINDDFKEKIFTGVIKLIALRMKDSADSMVQLMKRIKDFHDENRDELGEVTLFTTEKREDVNQKAVGFILELMKSLNENRERSNLTLSDLFQLEFRVRENDNDTGWVAKISHVGSEGTDTLVKAMVNIMLINVFKEKVSKKFGDFRIHCMMDEIGKLHPQNVKGILEFANSRNIFLINSSPITNNVSGYRYIYCLEKDSKSHTVVKTLISHL